MPEMVCMFGPSFRWIQYQCAMVLNLNRMKSRYHSGFEYGFGFRDILQDILAGLSSDSAKTRSFIKYIGEQMFSDGSTYHNFYVSDPGTLDFHACDDPIWFIYAVCEYVKEIGDTSLLDEVVPYADEKEGKPAVSGSVFEHCCKDTLFTSVLHALEREGRIKGDGSRFIPVEG